MEMWSTRLVREGVPAEKIRGPKGVATFVTALLEDEPQECFVVVALNTQHQPVGASIVTRGIVDASLIHPREVFRTAILANASGIILAHNHPSGNPEPSPEDRDVTRQLAEAGKIVGIPVIDHLIVTPERYYSFQEHGET